MALGWVVEIVGRKQCKKVSEIFTFVRGGRYLSRRDEPIDVCIYDITTFKCPSSVHFVLILYHFSTIPTPTWTLVFTSILIDLVHIHNPLSYMMGVWRKFNPLFFRNQQIHTQELSLEYHTTGTTFGYFVLPDCRDFSPWVAGPLVKSNKKKMDGVPLCSAWMFATFTTHDRVQHRHERYWQWILSAADMCCTQRVWEWL